MDGIKKIALIFLLVLIYKSTVLAQNTSIIKNKFIDAEYYFLYDEYQRAVPLYMAVYNTDSTNANVCYRLGLCYLQSMDEKNEAIRFLEKAATGITTDKYDEGSFKERHAPREAYLQLGHALRLDNQLDKAVEAYKTYISTQEVSEVYNINMANRHIETCQNAQQLMKFPVKAEFSNIIELNDDLTEYNPVLPADGSFIIYTSRRISGISSEETKFVYTSLKSNNIWETPYILNNYLKTEENCESVSLSADGKTLLLCYEVEGKKDIYISHYKGKKWMPIEKLNSNINTKSSESYACLSPNGKTLYFTSNRKGGLGGMDIYKSEKKEGNWGPAVNLGPSINTPFNEASPYVCTDGKTLYFSSEGHYSMGGYDIFYSTLIDNEQWSTPLNIGYPVNTTDDNIFFFPMKNGEEAYYSQFDKNGKGEKDLLLLKIPVVGVQPLDSAKQITDNKTNTTTTNLNNQDSIYNSKQHVDNQPNQTTNTMTTTITTKEIQINGKITLQDNKETDESFNIKIINSQNAQTVTIIKPEKNTGKFSYPITTGNFEFIFSGNDYRKKSEFVVIPENYTSSELSLHVEMVPEEVSSGDYIVIKSIFFLYSNFELTRQSKIELENIVRFMKDHPTLYIEVTGHTDSKGSSDFNKSLSLKRARATIDYLVEKGIKAERFVAKGMGEEKLVALDQFPDGSDNPEGRQLNRRVDLKILKSKEDMFVTYDHYPLPDYLKEDIKYTIFLMKQKDKYTEKKFANYSEHKTTDGYLYTLGDYNHKSDAVKMLNNAIDLGFNDAKIISLYELKKLRDGSGQQIIEVHSENAIYTIQIKALKNPVDVSRFSNLSGVKRIYIKNDNLYRYTYGEFKGYTKAREELKKVIELGYQDAFIVNIEKFLNK